jgi:aryl-alcohol dehydrogenase-like predicted oxidoreductase
MRYLDAGTVKKISRIGLGTWQFGSPESGYGWREAPAIIRRALELGVTLFDTSEIYGVDASSLACRALGRGVALRDTATMCGFGRSEQILGQALGQHRESAFLATKFYPAGPVAPSVRVHAAASANRLRTQQLDLYQIHQPGRLPHTGAIMRCIRSLQQAGVVSEVGVSNASIKQWRSAEDALGGRVLSNQVGYSLGARSAERDVLPFARSHERVVIAHSPLARGLLSGKYDSANRPRDPARAADPLFLPENLDRAGSLIAVLREVAEAHSATPAQIALAWVIHQPAVVAIPGATSVEQLEYNVAAADIELGDDEYRTLRAASGQFHPVPAPAPLPRRLRARFWAWYTN